MGIYWGWQGTPLRTVRDGVRSDDKTPANGCIKQYVYYQSIYKQSE
jgi:hypothetical protein